MGKIQIIKTGITSLNTDALVNAANERLWQGGGVCGIIFQAAGASQLQAACNAIGSCDPGHAVITPGFNLKSKYIIHAVGPRWMGGNHDEPRLLYSAYKQSLQLAVQYGCKSVGFPLISAGIFGYPVDKAWREAIQACVDFQEDHPETDLDIQFAVIDDFILSAGKKILAELKKGKTTVWLKELNEEGFEHFKQKLCRNSGLLIEKNTHPMAAGLMSILTDSKVVAVLSLGHVIRMINTIFSAAVLDEGWVVKYSDMLLRAVDGVKKNTANNRAQKYEAHLRNVLIPLLRNGANSGDAMDDLETLEDIYITAACLYRFYSGNGKEFEFYADRADTENLNQAVRNVKNTGNQVLGLAFAPVKTEECQYATFLGWVLEELIAQQENRKEGKM